MITVRAKSWSGPPLSGPSGLKLRLATDFGSQTYPNGPGRCAGGVSSHSTAVAGGGSNFEQSANGATRE